MTKTMRLTQSHRATADGNFGAVRMRGRAESVSPRPYTQEEIAAWRYCNSECGGVGICVNEAMHKRFK